MMLLWTLATFVSIGLAREVYLDETFDGKTSLDDWTVPQSSDTTLGEFVLSTYKYSNNTKNLGMKTSQDLRFYWISKKFSEPISTKNNTLVVQFSVAFEQNIDCGGGYIKLYSSKTDQSALNATTPYYIMFGPDICGPSKRIIQAILNHKGKNLEIRSKLSCKDDQYTHVYTLVLKPDRTFVIKTDNEPTRSGKLEDDWEFLPPRKIKDPNAKKPADWDDKEFIDDKDDKKPADWDQPQFIKDKDAVKPSDWNDEEDGTWEPPMIDNPDYKGEWKPRTTKNPNYQGPWQHPLIDNPEYNPDDSIGIYEDVALWGIDVWQVKSGTIFDNFLVTDDESYAAEKAAEILENAKNEREMKAKLDAETSTDSTSGRPDDDEEDDKGTSNDDDLIDEDDTENDEEDEAESDKSKTTTSKKPDLHDHEEL